MGRAQFIGAFLASLSFCSFSSPAAAQIGTDSRAVEMELGGLKLLDTAPFIYRSDAEQVRAAWSARSFARCAVKFSDDRSRELLEASIAGSRHPLGYEERFFRRLRNCAPSSGTNDVGLIRGALAERLLLSTRVPQGFRATTSVPELISYLRFVEALEASDENLVTVTQLGYQCRAAVSPSATYAVLQTEPESPQEEEALAALDRRSEICDVFFGRGEEVSHWFRRAFVARGLYYWQRFLEA